MKAALTLFLAALWLAASGSHYPSRAQSSQDSQQVLNSDESLNDIVNKQYVIAANRNASVSIRPFAKDANGNVVNVCNVAPSAKAFLFPDTKYFAQFLNASIHGQKLIDRDQRNHGITIFGLLDYIIPAPCEGDVMRQEGIPHLPYIVSVALPPQLRTDQGSRLIAHIQPEPNKTTDLSLSDHNLVGINDTVKVRGGGIDYAQLKQAYSQLPTSSMEGLAAAETQAALDRGDLRAAAASTIQYVEACVQVQRCSDSLRQSLLNEFQKNQGWFEFFGLLATAGSSSEEEIALSRVGREFKAAAVETTENQGLVAAEIDILKAASTQKGNFGLGIVTQPQAMRIGEAWVGPGYTVSSEGDVWISSNKLRQFRLPSTKRSPLAPTGTQANLESRLVPTGQFQSNGHLDIRP